MSSFICEKCGKNIIDTLNGYVTGCEHYPLTSRLEITLTATPSLNTISSNKWSRIGWKNKYLRELRGYEILGIKEQNLVKKKVTYIRYGSRTLDVDNFIGGTKALTDALKEKRLIWDDNKHYLEAEYKQVKCKRGEEKTIVIIEEALV